MKARLLVILIAIAFALAGCLGQGDNGVDPVDDENGDPSQDPQDPDAAQNGDDPGNGNGDDNGETPPSAHLSANVTTGEVPLALTFTLDGSHPDEGELTWTFDVGDGSPTQQGDEFPTTLEHIYDETGTFTAKLEVFKGELSDQATLQITVQEPGEPAIEPNPVQTGENSLCLDYLILWALNGEPLPGGVHSPLGESENVSVDPGTGYTIETEGNVTIDFYSQAGHYLDSGGPTGIVPAEAAYAYVCVLLGVTGQPWPDVPDPAGTFSYQDGF